MFTRTCCLLLPILPGLILAQSTAGTVVSQRDPSAVSALNAAISALGTTPPADSLAQATVQLADGSSASLTIKTLGNNSTAEDLVTSKDEERSIYVAGESNLLRGASVESRSAELAASSRSSIFVLPELAAAIGDSDITLQYVGQEGSNLHIRLWNTFSSRPRLARLSPFTRRDIWFDATTGLPSKIAFEHRPAEGAVPAIAVELDFSSSDLAHARQSVRWKSSACR
jgi:hypothetical protein